MIPKVTINVTVMCYLNSFAFSVALLIGAIWHHISHEKGLFGRKDILLFIRNNKIIINFTFAYITQLKYALF